MIQRILHVDVECHARAAAGIVPACTACESAATAAISVTRSAAAKTTCAAAAATAGESAAGSAFGLWSVFMLKQAEGFRKVNAGVEEARPRRGIAIEAKRPIVYG